MQVLHAGLITDCLMIWGEASASNLTSTPKKQRRQQRAEKQAALLPYDAGDKLLSASLAGVIDLSNHQEKCETVVAWLPAVNGLPVAFSALIAEQPSPGEQLSLSGWRVTAYRVPIPRALELLCACVAKETLAPGALIGADLKFWATAMQFAGRLVARQQFLPGLDLQGTPPRARWEPVYAGPDANTLSHLARAMPHACRALTEAGAVAVPDAPAATVLSAFLQQAVDALVRASLAPATTVRATKPQPKKAPAFASTHDQWLHALRAPDGTLTGSETELSQLAEQIREWQRPITVSTTTPFRLCFRLEEPEEAATAQTTSNGDTKRAAGIKRQRNAAPSANWYVRYLLQSTDDPSLLVPVAQAWNPQSKQSIALRRRDFNPREYLLAALGQAASLSPDIERSLKAATPGGYETDAAGAYAFLQEQSWLLEQSGFGVMLPAWWTRKGTKLKLSVRANVQSGKLQGGGGMSLEEIVSFNWEVALGEEKLTLRELEMLAQLKAPLVKVRGQWVELSAAEIEAAIDFWKKRGTDRATVRDIARMALGATSPAGELEFAGVTASGWVGEFLSQLEGQRDFAALPPPRDFQGELRPYQVRGYSWLAFLRQWGLGACLADDMGLGKCVGADTLIVVNGMLIKAEDLWRHYAGETAFDGEGYWAAPAASLLTNAINEETGRMSLSQIKGLYRQWVRERVRTIKLEDGSSVTITRQHKLLTNKGWTNELCVGDYVCVPSTMIWDGQPADPDLIKLLAWQIAEGYESQNSAQARITQKDVSVLEELRQCLLRFSARQGIEINRPCIRAGSNNRVADLRLCSMDYRRFLEDRGYVWGRRSREKSIPPFIMQADLNSARLFLRNYFDAEASVVESMRSIEISTASPLLIQQLSCLLRRFGIWLRLCAKQKCATNGTRTFRTYHIGTLGGNAARRFSEEIGFATPEKQKRLERICQRSCNTNVEGIPASEIMARTIALTKLPVRHFGMHNTVYLNGSQQFSRASLKRVLAGCERILSGEAERQYRQQKPSKWTLRTLDAYAHLDTLQLSVATQNLQHLLDQEVFYCKIKGIEEQEYDGWVYDFEVENHHNFVANNILCHNTAQALALVQRDWQENKARPTLVVCPMSVVGNWQKEATRFTPSLPVMVHHGLTRAKGRAFIKEATRHAIVLSSYSLLHRDFEILKEVDWAGVILDEAQNIKNAQTKQAQAARALGSDYRVALTGTPVENNVGDLWSLMEFLNPGLLGTQAEFKRRFFIPIQAQRDEAAARHLKRVTGPFILRRLKTDKQIIADLPEKLEMKVFCTLTKEQASLYEAVVKDASESLDETEGIQRKGVVLATLSRLKQVCNHPAQFLGDNSAIPNRSGKLSRLTEMLDEVLQADERALVFTQFAEMGALIQRHLQETFGQEVLFLHGAVPKQQRDRMVARFQSGNGGPRVFLLSLKAGGTGLNLTAANHVFHFDRWWNPAVENQATDRAFRIGQRRNVQVHKFICAGTLEERIDEMIERKQDMAERIVGSGESWLTELSTSALKELFALREEAVAE